MPPRRERRPKRREDEDEDGFTPIGEGSVMKEIVVQARKTRRTTAQDEAPPAADAEEWEDAASTDDDDGSVDERFEDMDDGEVIVSDEDADPADDDDEDADYKDFQKEAKKHVTFADGSKGEIPIDEEGDDEVGKVWRRDKGDKLAGDQKLDYSNRAYDTFFQLRSEYPCLSFDIVRDELGNGRTKYPLSMSFVCGSQAPEAGQNQLYAIKVSNVLRTKHDVEDEEASDDDMFGADDSESDHDEVEEELNNGEPVIAHQTVKHHGTVNRLRINPANSNISAVWSDNGTVQVFDLYSEIQCISDNAAWTAEQAVAGATGKTKKPAMRFVSTPKDHTTEGYALAWSTVAQNHFASGDCAGRIVAWQPAESRWAAVAGSPVSMGRSVEEIQWSPVQPNVMFATRAGGDVEVWDARDMKKSKLTWRADPTDINVASWNKAKMSSHLIATGADSGVISLWDLRSVKGGNSVDPLQQLTFHQGAAITSIEFSEHNECVLAATADDGQCTLWDLSLERDPNEEREVMGELFDRDDTQHLPDQLMFQHQGLLHPKEVHFHPQVPGLVLTTDFEGLHLFKPRNWRSLMK